MHGGDGRSGGEEGQAGRFTGRNDAGWPALIAVRDAAAGIREK
jgi:hypothetical protein